MWDNPNPLFSQWLAFTSWDHMHIVSTWRESAWDQLFFLIEPLKNILLPYESDQQKYGMLNSLRNRTDGDLAEWFLTTIFHVYEGNLESSALNELQDALGQIFKASPELHHPRLRKLLQQPIFLWLHHCWRARRALPPQISHLPQVIDLENRKTALDLEQTASTVTILYCADAPKEVKSGVDALVSSSATSSQCGVDCANVTGTIPSIQKRIANFVALELPYVNDTCAAATLEILRTGEGLTRNVLLLSPWMQKLGTPFQKSLHKALEFRSAAGEPPIFGFPAFDTEEGAIHWPVYKIRHQYWKMQWKNYATGYARALSDFAAAGETTSATRLLDLDVIRPALNEDGIGLPLLSMRKWESFFTEFDLLAKRKEWITGTMITEAMSHESHYLKHSVWHIRQSTYHEAEMVKFGDNEVQKMCLPSNVWTATVNVERFGIVSNPCYREVLVQNFVPFFQWWQDMDPGRHFAYTASGGILTPFRGGQISPWEHDFDMIFITTNPNFDFKEDLIKRWFYVANYGGKQAYVLAPDPSTSKFILNSN